jgi:transposase
MKGKYILGIDISKATFHYCLQLQRDRSVSKIAAGSWSNHPTDITRFTAHLQTLIGQAPLHAGMEATGRYGHNLFLALHEAGARVSVINPAQVKFFARSLNRRGKNDPMDASLLALYVREREPRAILPLDDATATLKEMVGEIDSLVAESVRISNRITEVAKTCKDVADSLRRRKNLVATEITKLEKAILELIKSQPHMAQQHRLLCSIKGIAARTAARVLAHLGGKVFSSARQLAAYAGVTPRENTSGTSLNGKTRMSKQGNARLRCALYIPALVFWKHCPQVKLWADAIAVRTNSKKAALGAVMRKLTHVIFGVLKHNTPFDPSRVCSPVSFSRP